MKKKVIIVIAVIAVIIVIAGLIVPKATKKQAAENASVKTEVSSSATGTGAPAEIKSEVSPSATGTVTPAENKPEESASVTEAAASSEIESELSSTEPEADQEGGIEEGEYFGGGSSLGGGYSSGGGGSAGGQETAASSSDNSGSESQPGTQTQVSAEEFPEIPVISFPYSLSGSDLVVEQITPYDGYFIEDGSDKSISGVAAIVLTNNGGDLEFAGIGISQGTRSLAFSASQIPAGATVIILEQNGAAFSSDPYYSATATTTPVDSFDMSKDLVTVKDNGKNALTVTNISDQTLSEVKILYKNYLPDDNVYVGGITYTITLADLEKDTSVEVSANHYDSNYSVVVEVEAKQ